MPFRKCWTLGHRRIADPPVPYAGELAHSPLLLRMNLRIKQSPDCAEKQIQHYWHPNRSCTSGGNLPEQWKRFLRTFEQCLVATGRADKPDPVKMALLLRTIGQRGNDMFDASTWDADADRQVYQTVVDKYNSFKAPRVNVVAMTHKLLTKKQG